MKMKKVFAGVCVFVMICAAAMTSAGAYFTDYDPAQGGKSFTYSLQQRVRIKEMVDQSGKHVVINNSGDEAVQVRCRAYYPTYFEGMVSYSPTGSWRDGGDGWYYYDDLEPDADTDTLDMAITLPGEMLEIMSDEINVVVVYESIGMNETWGGGTVNE